MLLILLHVAHSVSPLVTMVLIKGLPSPAGFVCTFSCWTHLCGFVSSQEILPLAPPTAIMALISLEDLEGLDDEQVDDDITDNPEPMDGDDRLLSHWQAVASTHQVSVPPGEGLRVRKRLGH